MSDFHYLTPEQRKEIAVNAALSIERDAYAAEHIARLIDRQTREGIELPPAHVEANARQSADGRIAADKAARREKLTAEQVTEARRAFLTQRGEQVEQKLVEAETKAAAYTGDAGSRFEAEAKAWRLARAQVRADTATLEQEAAPKAKPKGKAKR